jgi:hypothetical protein
MQLSNFIVGPKIYYKGSAMYGVGSLLTYQFAGNDSILYVQKGQEIYLIGDNGMIIQSIFTDFNEDEEKIIYDGGECQLSRTVVFGVI